MSLSEPVKVHLKIDSGMHRLGLTETVDIMTQFNALKTAPHVILEGVFTHMATADNDEAYLKQQIKMFEEILSQLDLDQIRYVHLSNTATLLQYDFAFDHAIRLGLGLYGVNPDADYIPLNFELQPALCMYSNIVQVKQIKKGDKVGYGATYTAPGDEIIGVVPIGYADGWIRAHQGRNVYVDGHPCEIVGRVCMDQMMIRLPHMMPMGTKVTLIGPEIPVEVIGKELKTISYEILCTISDRVPRVYLENGKITTVRKMRFEHES